MEASQSDYITIIGATYGLADVTSKVADLVKEQKSVTIKAANSVFGDSWYGVVKALSIVFRINNGPMRVVVCKENESITIQTSKKNEPLKSLPTSLQVYGATYGPADVTDNVQSLISSNGLSIQASNKVFGDPWYGIVKNLTIIYSDGTGNTKVAVVKENDWIVI